MESHLLGYFQKASRRAWGLRKPLMGGGGQGVAGQGWSSTWHPFFPLMPFVYDIKWGHFWVFGMATLPLGFPINRR